MAELKERQGGPCAANKRAGKEITPNNAEKQNVGKRAECWAPARRTDPAFTKLISEAVKKYVCHSHKTAYQFEGCTCRLGMRARLIPETTKLVPGCSDARATKRHLE